MNDAVVDYPELLVGECKHKTCLSDVAIQSPVVQHIVAFLKLKKVT